MNNKWKRKDSFFRSTYGKCKIVFRLLKNTREMCTAKLCMQADCQALKSDQLENELDLIYPKSFTDLSDYFTFPCLFPFALLLVIMGHLSIKKFSTIKPLVILTDFLDLTINFNATLLRNHSRCKLQSPSRAIYCSCNLDAPIC